MHAHLIDWFRNVFINSDIKLVEQRWSTAQKYAEGLTRESIPQLIRLFLFSEPDSATVGGFTNELLAFDKEFPVANNIEDLRLMAGVVMVTTFKTGSRVGNAFALGLRAARFPSDRGNPAQPAILSEADKYLQNEADEQRPNDFDADPQIVEDILGKKLKAMREAEKSNDAAQIQTAQTDYTKAVAKAIKESHRALAGRVRRLAEETALLWWVLAEHSTLLNCGTCEVTAVEYALAAALEAAQRTHILPPPPSINALLARSLKPCKRQAKKKLVLSDYIAATKATWRADQLKKVDSVNCPDLVPIATALSKCQEFNDTESAIKVLPILCSGVTGDLMLSPAEAAQQFYSELMFLKALATLKSP